MNRNLLLVSIFFSFWFFILTIFLIYIQIYKYDYFYKKSLHIEEVKIIPKRGIIYDRNGNILAGSYEEYTGKVAIDTKNYTYEKKNLEDIKNILNLPEKVLKKAIKLEKGYIVLKKDAKIEQLKELETLKIPGLIIEKGYKRVYPYEELMSHIIGWVDWENNGISGLEYFYNNHLKGKEGEKLVLRDRIRYSYDLGEEITPVVPGKDIVLTIDTAIQYMAKRSLENLKRNISYEWGAITVINPKNGEILAHSIDPPFSYEKKGLWQDEHLASSCYEPGSIIKPFFADTALRLNLIEPDFQFDCSKGFLEISGVKIRDHHKFGVLNFSETLYFSSNVGCILWSSKIPDKEFYKTIEAYGFLRRTGIEVPSEVRGNFNNQKTQLSRAYITLGQSISVTSAQILRAYSALINGGYLVKPHFFLNKYYKEKLPFKPEFEKLKPILYQTVIKGTGVKAQIPFISMGGKTGTAQLSEGGRYIQGYYISSFVCWFPLDEPKYLVLVVVKKPRPLYYGGDVAAPVARNISFYLFLKGQESESL